MNPFLTKSKIKQFLESSIPTETDYANRLVMIYWYLNLCNSQLIDADDSFKGECKDYLVQKILSSLIVMIFTSMKISTTISGIAKHSAYQQVSTMRLSGTSLNNCLTFFYRVNFTMLLCVWI